MTDPLSETVAVCMFSRQSLAEFCQHWAGWKKDTAVHRNHQNLAAILFKVFTEKGRSVDHKMDGTWMTRSMSAAAVGLSGWISSWSRWRETMNFRFTIAEQTLEVAILWSWKSCFLRYKGQGFWLTTHGKYKCNSLCAHCTLGSNTELLFRTNPRHVHVHARVQLWKAFISLYKKPVLQNANPQSLIVSILIDIVFISIVQPPSSWPLLVLFPS